MTTMEANFDGLVGPTHNYSGLAIGNVASARNARAVSNPREAALQGLDKMKALHDLGLVQGVLPPQERPHLPTLRRLGFTGNDSAVLARAAREAPDLLAACASASSMWAANAATVSPSADTADGRVHFTAANLCSQTHRAIEAPATAAILGAIFADSAHFRHHPPLPSTPLFGDEGAANHNRLCAGHGEPGLELFVYGRRADGGMRPAHFPARQTLQASTAVARLHRLAPSRIAFAQQNPAAIDAGVFHNDVIAVANENVLFCHEQAFVDRDAVRARVDAHFGDMPFHWLEVAETEVSLRDAVDTYLFNSQLATLEDDGGMALIVPAECRETPAVWAYLEGLIAGSHPISRVHVLDVRQSMRNGGGPACLRLRVALTEAEKAAIRARVFLDDALYHTLRDWIERYYRDRLSSTDLADPQLLDESRTALDELTRVLGLGSIFCFQTNTPNREDNADD